MRIERRTSTGTCRSCGARIEWATVVGSQRRLPFNPPIVILPNIPALLDDGGVDVDLDRTESHFTTCPQASQWRKAQTGR